jgi:formate hydrogenlyase subunit 4
MLPLFESFFYQLAQTLIVLVAAPLMLGWVNQCRAWLQNRSGAGVLQPYRVLAKLFQKDVVMARDASRCSGWRPTCSSAAWCWWRASCR